MQLTIVTDVNRLSGQHVGDKLKTQHIECNALGGDHKLRFARSRFPLAIAQWSNAMRITEANDALSNDHGNNSIGTNRLFSHSSHRVKKGIGRIGITA